MGKNFPKATTTIHPRVKFLMLQYNKIFNVVLASFYYNVFFFFAFHFSFYNKMHVIKLLSYRVAKSHLLNIPMVLFLGSFFSYYVEE